jgi:hypothetical protein
MHTRTYDNKRADLQSRSWDKDFDPRELADSLEQLRVSAEARFPVMPLQCRPARPELMGLLQDNAALMDSFGGVMSQAELEEYDSLLPAYQRMRRSGEKQRAVVEAFERAADAPVTRLATRLAVTLFSHFSHTSLIFHRSTPSNQTRTLTAPRWHRWSTARTG